MLQAVLLTLSCNARRSTCWKSPPAMSWDTAAMSLESERPSTGFGTNLTSADLVGRGQEIRCGLK